MTKTGTEPAQDPQNLWLSLMRGSDFNDCSGPRIVADLDGMVHAGPCAAPLGPLTGARQGQDGVRVSGRNGPADEQQGELP